MASSDSLVKQRSLNIWNGRLNGAYYRTIVSNVYVLLLDETSRDSGLDTRDLWQSIRAAGRLPLGVRAYAYQKYGLHLSLH